MTANDTICYCKGVTRATIVNAIRAGARTLKDIQKMTRAATGNQCKQLNPKGTCCAADVREILKQETGIKDDTPCCKRDCCSGEQ